MVTIFIVRPFDVGDRITLPGFPTLIVHSIHLMVYKKKKKKTLDPLIN